MHFKSTEQRLEYLENAKKNIQRTFDMIKQLEGPIEKNLPKSWIHDTYNRLALVNDTVFMLINDDKEWVEVEYSSRDFLSAISRRFEKEAEYHEDIAMGLTLLGPEPGGSFERGRAAGFREAKNFIDDYLKEEV